MTQLTDSEKKDFFEACTDARIDIVAAILDKSPEAVNLRSPDGWTPLFLAVQWARTETVELLLARGADMAAQDGNGRTPLDQAHQLNYESITDIFRAAAQQRDQDAAREAHQQAVRQFSDGLDAPMTLPRKTLRLQK